MMRLKNHRFLVTAAVLVALALVAVRAEAIDHANCAPSEVATLFNERVHIKCSSPVKGIVYFAVPMSNSDLANQVLSLGATAIVHKKRLVIQFEMADNSGPAYGCALSDCRPLLGMQLVR